MNHGAYDYATFKPHPRVSLVRCALLLVAGSGNCITGRYRRPASGSFGMRRRMNNLQKSAIDLLLLISLFDGLKMNSPASSGDWSPALCWRFVGLLGKPNIGGNIGRAD